MHGDEFDSLEWFDPSSEHGKLRVSVFEGYGLIHSYYVGVSHSYRRDVRKGGGA